MSEPTAHRTPDFNPYAAPATVSEICVVARKPIRTPWLRRVILLQSVVIVTALFVEAIEHETIVGSGPVFALFGLIIAILAYRNRDRAALLFGLSAVAFASLIVFLINYNSWGPRQGNLPISILSYIYAVVALPISAWLVSARSRSRGDDPSPQGDGGGAIGSG
ncbi:MAG: hypothetical protein AAFU85_24135 [Planctomycetota bacterium]